MNKYCVASVHVDSEKASVSYYAYLNNSYGLHKVDSWKDDAVCWYDTEKEAMQNRINHEDCVLRFNTDYIPKFSKVEVK
ncbi:hypothetical protein [[Clostridium] polysaccharolyticum]|uniref:Uncharacterized protein n=1 Tax=[Clostridium] polysaccharolyticum TaxID=29364 RepID=A0A1H9YK62_9FIRM|nr:hypothetical protein [[Clostridium] polysaccharolyticum]SES69376.1 hypothetical protein SAMN04487772_10260 [[Clostridium] polysaccharolyticum]